MDLGSTEDQARESHGNCAVKTRGYASAARLSGEPSVSANAETVRVQSGPETEERDALERAWQEPRGLIGWFSVTTHQTLGKRYIVTAFIFLLIGGIEALLMRLQLSRPENTLLGPGRYNQIFTMHGTTMMFLFAVPVMEG